MEDSFSSWGCNRDTCMIGLLWKVIILNPRVKNSYMYLVLTRYCSQLCLLVFFFDHKALEKKKTRNNLTWYRSGARDSWEGMKCTMYPGCQRLFLRGLSEDFRHSRERNLCFPLSEEWDCKQPLKTFEIIPHDWWLNKQMPPLQDLSHFFHLKFMLIFCFALTGSQE